MTKLTLFILLIYFLPTSGAPMAIEDYPDNESDLVYHEVEGNVTMDNWTVYDFNTNATTAAMNSTLVRDKAFMYNSRWRFQMGLIYLTWIVLMVTCWEDKDSLCCQFASCLGRLYRRPGDVNNGEVAQTQNQPNDNPSPASAPITTAPEQANADNIQNV